MIPEVLPELLKKDGVVAIATIEEDGADMVNIWNTCLAISEDGRLLISAGYTAGLSRLIGPERVVWRYDPVVLTDRFTPEWHKAAFSRLAVELSGYTERCIISFLDDYRKIRSWMRDIRYVLPDTAAMEELAGRFADTAGKQSIALLICSHDIDLSRHGIMHSRCVDAELIERISGRRLWRVKKDSSQRHACGCVESRDIGSYNTCGHGCLYCYAMSSHAKVSAACKSCDPLSPLLCDELRGDEAVTTVPVRKHISKD